ncbi:MAG: gluconolaconase [Woeseia sp.]|nr:gluconolaconase [Woeseia sp.]|tara:strand:+ start:868 stop:1788 length:921 start_codon:yes stop_codon:yes gene_type:complete
MADFEVIATGLKFPEGPIAMADGSVIVVEIAAGRLSRVEPDGNVQVIAELGGAPNGAAIGPDGHCYVCNNGGFTWVDVDGMLFPEGTPDDYDGGRIERVNLETGEHEVLFDSCNGNRLNGPNDIVFDNHGGFWFTDAGKLWPRQIARGGVYYVAADAAHIEEVFYPQEFPNGIALSPTENTLYFCETMNGRIWSYSLSGPGQLAEPLVPSNPENLLHAPGGLLGFDSMCVDSHGNVCQATLFQGGISVVSPTGDLVEFIDLPDPLVTNICFGGEDLCTAYITLSATGQLISMPWTRPGHRLNFQTE